MTALLTRLLDAPDNGTRDGIILEARDLTKAYPLGETTVHALRGVSLTVGAGEFVALMGPSGSGKSTLLQLLGGLDRPSSGEVVLEGEIISELSDDRATRLRRDRTGFVFQSFNLIPLLDVTENIALPFTIAGLDPSRGEIAGRIKEVIALVDLTGKEHHKPDQLSAGEQQRVAVARALVTRPALLFADEPTGNLDYTTGTEILDALWRSCQERHQTMVLVTHDSKAAAYADRVHVVGDGQDPRHHRARPARRPRRDRPHRPARQPRSLSRMRGLHGLAWRGLRARPLRTALTTIGVALGVAVLYAGLATNAGIGAAVDRAVSTLVGRADLRVAAFGEVGLSEATLATIRDTPGVDVAAPSFERRTYLGTGQFGPGPLPAPVTLVGIDPALEPRIHDLTLAAGSPLEPGDDPSALVSATLARQDGLIVGSRVGLQGIDAPVYLRVAGILAGDGPWAGATGRAVVTHLPVAQSVFGADGLTRIDLELTPGTDPAAVVDALEATLLAEPYVVSSPRDLAIAMQASTGDFAATTALIAAIALFAGAFLIFNTLSMTVVERVRELGLLRAAGATRSQVTSLHPAAGVGHRCRRGRARDRRRRGAGDRHRRLDGLRRVGPDRAVPSSA